MSNRLEAIFEEIRSATVPATTVQLLLGHTKIESTATASRSMTLC